MTCGIPDLIAPRIWRFCYNGVACIVSSQEFQFEKETPRDPLCDKPSQSQCREWGRQSKLSHLHRPSLITPWNFQTRLQVGWGRLNLYLSRMNHRGPYAIGPGPGPFQIRTLWRDNFALPQSCIFSYGCREKKNKMDVQ